MEQELAETIWGATPRHFEAQDYRCIGVNDRFVVLTKNGTQPFGTIEYVGTANTLSDAINLTLIHLVA